MSSPPVAVSESIPPPAPTKSTHSRKSSVHSIKSQRRKSYVPESGRSDLSPAHLGYHIDIHDTSSDSEATNEPTKDPSQRSVIQEDHFLAENERWPTPEEEEEMIPIADTIPLAAFYVLVTEFCERFTYYGASGVFQNYIQNRYHGDANPGAIGGGSRMATALGNFFQFFCYITPVIGGIMADQYLGKYKTVLICAVVYMLGDLLLTLTALPVSIEHSGALPGLIISMLVIGFGTGGIKSNVSPMMADQYPRMRNFIRTEANGKEKLIDRDATVQSMFNWFYWAINIGSLSAIATTYLERDVGFWAAYLLPTAVFAVCIVAFWMGRNHYVITPPHGSVVVKSLRVMHIGRKMKARAKAEGRLIKDENDKPVGFMHYAKPSLMPTDAADNVEWDDRFVSELIRAVKACKIFLLYPVYWMTYNQMTTNLITQAGQMNTGALPNDILQNIDPLVLIILIPIFDKLVFPGLRKCGWELKPVMRISLGFMLGTFAMAYAAIVQHLIYTSGPNYEFPNANGGFNDISVGIQVPAYAFVAVGEIFASVTGLEYAYTKAPRQMKSVVMSLFLLTNSGGSILDFALNPLAIDPYFTIDWYVSAIICGVCTVLVYVLFRHYDKTEHSDNRI